jgi:hypothetical protein
VLALESVDLPPDWHVDELTADPDSIATDESGATVEVYRRETAPDGWPYYAVPDYPAPDHPAPDHPAHADQVDGYRVRLIPYYQRANRGPATMRTWLPAHTAHPGRPRPAR